jgi:hypothetical protein
MDISGLLAVLQARQDRATARADGLRGRMEHFTSTLAGCEAHLAGLATTGKIIAELVPAAEQTESDPSEAGTVCRSVVMATSQHARPGLPSP